MEWQSPEIILDILLNNNEAKKHLCLNCFNTSGWFSGKKDVRLTPLSEGLFINLTQGNANLNTVLQ